MKISNSEIRKFKRCRRAWWLTYYRKLRMIREGVGPLSLGNIIHSVLEDYYTTENRDPATFDFETPLAALVEARLADERLPEHSHGDQLDQAELARIMLRGYFEWLQDDGADSDLEITGAEQEIEAYLGKVLDEDVWLIGKLDLRGVIKSTGETVFVDHKSCQTLSDIPKTALLDEQVKMYGLLERMTSDHRTGGGLWNMLRKVKRTAAAKPPFYGRSGVQHNDEVYRTFHSRVWGEVADIVRTVKLLESGADPHAVAYPNPTRDCSWDCPFFGICPQFDDGSDVEGVIAFEYEVHDPYARYLEVEKG